MATTFGERLAKSTVDRVYLARVRCRYDSELTFVIPMCIQWRMDGVHIDYVDGRDVETGERVWCTNDDACEVTIVSYEREQLMEIIDINKMLSN